MNHYTVTWMNGALDELAALWIEAVAERDAITAAAHAIDGRLSVNPVAQASSEHEKLYVLDEPPLRVSYAIEEQALFVRIVRVRRVPPPLALSPWRNGPPQSPA